MNAVLTPPPDQEPSDAGANPAIPDRRKPLHAVDPGDDPHVAPTRRTGVRSTRMYAVLSGIAALVCLTALIAYRLKASEPSGLKDPVISNPARTAEVAPAAEPVKTVAVPSQPASAAALPRLVEPVDPAEAGASAAAAGVAATTAEPTASVATAVSGTVRPTAAAAPASLHAPSEAQAAQGGIDARLTAALTQIQHDLAELKTKVDGLITGQAAATTKGTGSVRVARARPRPAASAAPAPVVAAAPAGTVLAVDLWDGHPSVVVGTGIAADKRVVFLREGDSKNGVTVKAANTAAQSALFDVNGRETLLRADGRSE